ncbi:YT521-B-like domain-containing protein [Flagelloscypha sp. PMI_526]|nr:YT521-B-like domain-containing protein [Flagelloscypha sp. PMI_526]
MFATSEPNFASSFLLSAKTCAVRAVKSNPTLPNNSSYPVHPQTSQSSSPSQTFQARSTSLFCLTIEKKDGVPQPSRTPWSIWLGNLPHKVSPRDLDQFLFLNPSFLSDEIVSSILISRSKCAFVNFASLEAFNYALREWNGVPLQPKNIHCPPLVCRPARLKEESGVRGQRMAGIHREWVKQRNQNMRDDISSGSDTQDSTDSTFLFKHFPIRYFILKSNSRATLAASIQNGTWSTQLHNVAVLDRAFRTSREVYLFFSENKSGFWFGYVKLAGGLQGIRSSTSMKRSNPIYPEFLGTHYEATRNSLSPLDDSTMRGLDPSRSGRCRSAPPILFFPARIISASPSRRLPLLSSISLPLLQKEAEHEQVYTGRADTPYTRGSSSSDDTLNQSDGPQSSHYFPISWIQTRSIKFSKARHIKNHWNHNREVKVSRDGTELDPSAGEMMLNIWKESVRSHVNRRRDMRKKKGGAVRPY